MVSPKSENGIFATSIFVLFLSKAAQPPLELCIPSNHCTARSMAWFLLSVDDSFTRFKAMTISELSSRSGYVLLWNSNAQPPGVTFLAFTCQSPPVRICSSTSQSPAVVNAGCSGSTPASNNAIIVRQVSHKGETQA